MCAEVLFKHWILFSMSSQDLIHSVAIFFPAFLRFHIRRRALYMCLYSLNHASGSINEELLSCENTRLPVPDIQ